MVAPLCTIKERGLGNETPKTVGEVLTAYIEDRRKHVLHPASLETHVRALRPFFGSKTLDEICERNVLRNLCHDFAQSRSNLSVNTNRKALIILQSALRLAWKRGVISGLPVMWIPDEAPKERGELSDQDRDAILTAADSYPTEPHLRAFIYITMFTGQHMSKVLSLKWDHVKFQERVLVFYKRDGSKEKIPMHPRLRGVLESAEERRQSDYVVEWRGKKVRNVYHGVNGVLDRAGIKDMSTLDLRLFYQAAPDARETPDADDERHVFISYCRRDGTEIASVLAAEFRSLKQAVWIDHVKMKAGNYSAQLTQAIKDATAVVLVLTEGANDSPDVLQEVARAKTANVKVLPISVKNVTLGPELKLFFEKLHIIQWADAKSTAQEALKTLGLRT